MIRFLSRLIFLCLLGSAAVLAAVENAPGPFVWKVSGEGLQLPSYLFGTIHVGGSEVQAIAEAAGSLLAEVDTLVTEIPMDAATMQRAGMLCRAPEEAPGLSEQLGPELTERVEWYLRERFPGVSLSLFERFEPWAFYLSLMTLEVQSIYPGQALDLQLYYRARVAKRGTEGLETVEEQVSAMKILTPADVRVLLAAELSLDASLVEEQLSAMLDAYLEGDVASFMTSYLAEIEDLEVPRELIDRFMKALLHDRDIRLAERIEARLRERPERSCLFAVGAMHLAGEHAIVARLEAAGFTLERLPYGAKVTVGAP